MKNLILALVVCALAGAQSPRALDLNGTWRIHFQDDNGVSTSAPKLVIRRTADKLTGTFGKFDWPIIGAVDGNHVVFSFVAYGHEGGQTISDTVFYWGTIDDKGTLKGRMKNPKEAGNWVAAKE